MGFFCVKKIGNEIYTSSFDANALLKISKDGLRYVKRFEKEDINAIKLHRTVIDYDDKLFFIPFSAKYISCYSITTGEIECFIPKLNSNDNICCSDAKKWKGKIYLFPRYRWQELYIIDPILGDIQPDFEFNKIMKEYGVGEKEKFDTFSVAQEDNIFWVVPFLTNKLIKFDCITKEHSLINIKSYKLRNITINKNDLWITCGDDSVVLKYNKQTRALYEYKSYDEGKRYHRVICKDDRVVVIPETGYQIDEIVDEKIVGDIEITGEDKCIKYSFAEYYEEEDKLIFLPLSDNLIKILDLKERRIIAKEFSAENNIMHKIFFENVKAQGVIKENNEMSLEGLIRGIAF